MQHIEPAATLSMAGKIRTKDKCPKCGAPFKGEPLSCALCLTRPKRYFIDLYDQKHGRIRIYSDKSGALLDSHARASRVLEHIRYEIDQKIFDHTKYVKADAEIYQFEFRIRAWLRSKEQEAEKDNLAQSYVSQLRRYVNLYYVPHFKIIDVRDIRAFYIQDFFEKLPRGLSLKYQKNILCALENFFNVLAQQDYIEKKPTFPSVIVDRKAPRWIDRKTQIEALNVVRADYRDIFAFMMFQGVRPGEAMTLKVKDIDFDKELFSVNRTYTAGGIRERVKSKTVKPRALNPALVSRLSELCANKHPEAFVFTSRSGNYFKPTNLNKAWLAVRKKLRLDVSIYQATRHSFASNALLDGSDLTSIGDLLGHADIRTTLKYAHADINNQRAVFKRQAEVLNYGPSYGPSRAPAGILAENLFTNQADDGAGRGNRTLI